MSDVYAMSRGYMNVLTKNATRKLFKLLEGVRGVELLEYDEGIAFKYCGHTYYFTGEFVE